MPRLYLSGLTKFNQYLWVVGYVEGITLAKYIEANQIQPEQYQSLENLVLNLWCCGFVHADLHAKNIMYNERENKFTIIDFGHAIKLDSRITDAVNIARQKGYPALKIFNAYIRKYVQAALWYREYGCYNSDALLLQWLQDPR